MQYLYLAILKNNEDVLPFYVDIAHYERIAKSDIQVSEDDIISQINTDFEEIKTIITAYSNKVPLLFLDGIRDFSHGNESLYYTIDSQIEALNCKLVFCLDADFTLNNQRQFNVHPLGSENFAHFMRIKPMSLHKKKESIEFIKKCIELTTFRIDISPEKIYDNLIRLSFSDIDAYWLIYILKTAPKQFWDTKGNLSDLYTAISIAIMGNNKLLDSASELAYNFEFGATDDIYSDSDNLYYDIRWRLILKHRSMLDFLIARHYIKKVSNLNLIRDENNHNLAQLKFFNMVLQKNITRFVVAMLKGVDDYEHMIMTIAKYHYDILSLFGKSELTFWMARLQNPRRKNECVKLLKEYHEKEVINYNNIDPNDVDEKRNAAFLLRGINVSLIYENDKDASEYYLNSLLNDKIANSVNRGFHLEYYGDKAYIPNKSLLDYEDDITKGEKTLTILCISLDRRIKRGETSSYVAALEIMTLCNLIQARIEQSDIENPLDVSGYINKCIRYLDWIIGHGQRIIRGLSNVAMYFVWMRNELHNLSLENTVNNTKKYCYSLATPFNKFSEAKSVKRTGWVNNGIPEPENIVEHMYNCWLIGMMYLPDTYDEEGYNKNTILQMLLIHDLSETETGDINRPEKLLHKHTYDFQENLVMQSFLLSGTYPGAVGLNAYIEHWNSWDRKEGINYLIAKDLDEIQAIFQFCNYYMQYPDNFSLKDLCKWLSNIYILETDIGKDIAEKLILNNPIYEDIAKQFSEIEENDI